MLPSWRSSSLTQVLIESAVGSPSSSAVTTQARAGCRVSNDLPIVVGVRSCQSRTETSLAIVAGDHLLGALLRDVAAALPDHDGELALVVEQARRARHVHVVARPDHASGLLVEEDRELGRLHAALGDVVGVVKPDCEVLPRGSTGATGSPCGRSRSGVVAIDDLISLDDAVARLPARFEPAEP